MHFLRTMSKVIRISERNIEKQLDTTRNISLCILFSPLHFVYYLLKSITFGTVYNVHISPFDPPLSLFCPKWSPPPRSRWPACVWYILPDTSPHSHVHMHHTSPNASLTSTAVNGLTVREKNSLRRRYTQIQVDFL